VTTLMTIAREKKKEKQKVAGHTKAAM